MLNRHTQGVLGPSGLGGGNYWAMDAVVILQDGTTYAAGGMISASTNDLVSFEVIQTGNSQGWEIWNVYADDDHVVNGQNNHTTSTAYGIYVTPQPLVAVPASVEWYNNDGAGCNGVPNATFWGIQLYAGQFDPPTYNSIGYNPTNQQQSITGSCFYGIIDNPSNPNYGSTATTTILHALESRNGHEIRYRFGAGRDAGLYGRQRESRWVAGRGVLQERLARASWNDGHHLRVQLWPEHVLPS